MGKNNSVWKMMILETAFGDVIIATDGHQLRMRNIQMLPIETNLVPLDTKSEVPRVKFTQDMQLHIREGFIHEVRNVKTLIEGLDTVLSDSKDEAAQNLLRDILEKTREW